MTVTPSQVLSEIKVFFAERVKTNVDCHISFQLAKQASLILGMFIVQSWYK
jgi:hypothetical protein